MKMSPQAKYYVTSQEHCSGAGAKVIQGVTFGSLPTELTVRSAKDCLQTYVHSSDNSTYSFVHSTKINNKNIIFKCLFLHKIILSLLVSKKKFR